MMWRRGGLLRMSWVEFITVIIAMIGAILGIYNTVVGYLRRSVQLKLQIGPASNFFDMALKEDEVWGLSGTAGVLESGSIYSAECRMDAREPISTGALS
jgi:hypothetical protein